MRHRADRWQISLLSAIMVMLAVVLVLSLGGAAYAWSPGPGQNVVVENGQSFSGKTTTGTERPMLTLINTNATRLNAPPAGAMFFTVANTEMMRIANNGNVGINDTTPTEGKLVVRNSNSPAIYSYCTSSNALYGESVTWNAVFGKSGSGNGVYGLTMSSSGVYGKSDGSGDGVVGSSVSGNAARFYGRVRVDGPVATAYRTAVTNTAVDETDSIVAVNASVAPLTVTLPSAAGATGRAYTIKRVNASNNVTIDPDGVQTIDGATTYTLSAQWDFITIISDGSNWLIVATD